VRARFVDAVNGLRMHVLEAGFEPAGRPALVLLHGFPELAYSWRLVMPALAEAGFHVIAPDQRGYGRTTGWSRSYDSDVAPYRYFNLVQDIVALTFALGHRTAAAVIGHDHGAAIAGYAALIRPDMFGAVAMMSAPFAGPPPPRLGSAEAGADRVAQMAELDRALASLTPPRKHYITYYSGPEAEADMSQAPQGLHAFLRAYYHVKSADWAGNRPYPLQGRTAADFAALPDYYVMPRALGMGETVAAHMPSAAEIAACRWLPDEALAVYAGEYARTGFQGGLNGYRARTAGAHLAELGLLSGRKIEVPACFISGAEDWGVYQTPGALEAMHEACARPLGVHLLPRAGNWVQQEQPQTVVRLILDLVGSA
jgi:pimeloyl-ACP methyl ester carboxylesterase